MTHRNLIRNFAIIAHVDHGKTTLVDCILKQTKAHTFHEGDVTVMDSNSLEQERGITIFSKNASCEYKGHHYNIVDTPGHADFGSEVERILKMVDGVLLIVDAFEGPMPQTKFVLKKALALGLRPILVINKIDRPDARPDEVVDLTFDLFCELNANDKQLEFPIIYGSAKDGWATNELNEKREDMTDLLDAIEAHMPAPVVDPNLSLQMQVTMLEYDNFVGRVAVGRVHHGTIKVGQQVVAVAEERSVRGKITKILACKGMERISIDFAEAGDIVYIAGIDEVTVGDTICPVDKPKTLAAIPIDPPTVTMSFGHNTSPLSGKDGGKFLTSRQIRDRLEHEAMINVGLKVEEAEDSMRFKVSGRGELHLAILIETMRREGYEIEVSQPQVIFKEIDGKRCEPIQDVFIEVDSNYQGTVMQMMGSRKGELKNMTTTSTGSMQLEFTVAARALFGFRNELLTLTKGTGIMYQNFLEYQPFKGEFPSRKVGVLISQTAQTAVAFALFNLQDRGEIFIKPGDDLYEGMIVGVSNKGHDLTVNATKGKALTNMRASGTDEAIVLIPPREMTLEFALEFIDDDELVEVTPKNIRLRKIYLQEKVRRAKGRGRK